MRTGSSDLRVAVIDAAAIAHNVQTMRARVSPAAVMTVVKAGGYGHGALISARAAIAAGTDWLGVADIAEALALRAAGIRVPLLAWLHDPAAHFDSAVEADITLGVSTRSQIREAARVGTTGRPSRVHLKVDTGLGRSGAPRGEWMPFFEDAARQEQEGILVVEGIFSHLSNASESDDLEQLAVFLEACALAESAGLRPRIRHLAASGAALTLPQTHLDLVRIGVCAYGLSPLEGVSSRDLGLRPVMSLRSRVIAVKRVPKGTGVSYGYSHHTDSETTLALVGLGYADGIPRHVSNRGHVAISGGVHPIVGRIAMDQFVVSVGDVPVSVGDEVVLFGDPENGVPSADDWAAAASTINYEIVTRIGGRVQRREVGG